MEKAPVLALKLAYAWNLSPTWFKTVEEMDTKVFWQKHPDKLYLELDEGHNSKQCYCMQK